MVTKLTLPSFRNRNSVMYNLCQAGRNSAFRLDGTVGRKEEKNMEMLILGGGLLIVIIAVIVAVVSSVVSAVAASEGDGEL